MKTDIQEKDGKYILDMDLPGFKARKNIKADLKMATWPLPLPEMTQRKKKDEKGNLVHQERYTGQCSRSFYVGDNVKEDDIKAGYKGWYSPSGIPKNETKQVEQKNTLRLNKS